MKVKKKFLFLSLLFIIALMLFSSTSYAGSQSWNALDYDVTINKDGSANIVETWDVNISETNTLFKDFDLQGDKPYSFSNPKVTEIKNGKEYPLEQIYEEQYHVDPGCYFGLPIKYNTKYEIAWNVGLDNSSDTRTYKIYYTVNNAITIYNDCTEFYWQFLSDENTMTGKNVTGTIKIPNGIKDIEKLRVWAHGTLSGEIKKENLNKITFSVPNISSNEMLEVRIITENNIFPQSTNFQNINKLNDILEEEEKWAKEANLKRILYKIIIIVVVIVLLYIAILFLKKIIKYSKEGKELESKYSYPKSDLEYFRDIPNEKDATPARASYLFGYRQMNSNIFSASLLELTLRKIITLEPIDKKDANIIINNIELNIIQELPEDLKIVYELISSAASSASIGNSISISEFKKYARKNYEDYHKKFSAIEDAVDSYEHNCQNVSAEREKLKSKYSSKLALYICLIIFLAFALPFSLVYIIEILICIIICGKNVSRINILSKEGYEESNEWKGLKKYMEDFSLLNEKEVPDLILWEKYLVYATAFGISKKVLKQLEIVYPEIHNTNTYTGNYTYLNLMAHSDFDLGNSISNSLGEIYSAASNAYSSAHSSSSGGGGGFSGGGGGRRRRPEAVEDVKIFGRKVI